MWFQQEVPLTDLVLNDWSIASGAVLGGSRNFRMGLAGGSSLWGISGPFLSYSELPAVTRGQLSSA